MMYNLQVDEEILKTFSTLYGVFIVLQQYLEKVSISLSIVEYSLLSLWCQLNKADGTNLVVTPPIQILSALAKWTEDDSGSKKQWPDMLRAMKVCCNSVPIIQSHALCDFETSRVSSLGEVLRGHISIKELVYATCRQCHLFVCLFGIY